MPYLFLTFAAMFWGGNYVVGSLMVFHVPPIMLAELRWSFTAILLLLIYFKKIRSDWVHMRSSLVSLIFLALFGQVLFSINLYTGLQYIPPLNAVIYLSATPAIVLMINHSVFKDTITKGNILGVLVSTVGVFYLLAKGDFANLNSFSFFKNQGDFWTMGAALAWAFYCAFLRTKSSKISGTSFVAMTSLLGAIMILPFFVGMLVLYPDSIHGVIHPGQINPLVIVGIIYLVLFPSWISYLLWSKGIHAIGATRGEVFTHFVPLFGGIFSIVFLRNQVHLYHLVSAVLICFGIILCSTSKKRRC